MRIGFVITTGDPRTVADLAAEAERAGWDGAFYYDAIAIGDAPMYDPWVVMAAMAMRTERIRLGAIVTPPSPNTTEYSSSTCRRLSGPPAPPRTSPPPTSRLASGAVS